MTQGERKEPGTNARPEKFRLTRSLRHIEREIRTSTGQANRTALELPDPRTIPTGPKSEELADIFDFAFLKSARWPGTKINRNPVRSVDLFSGCGIMSLGLWEACRALGSEMTTAMAVDFNRRAVEVLRANFPSATTSTSAVELIFDGDLGRGLTPVERRFKKKAGVVDVLVAGPPCQGHSDLNNHTRRRDPKNALYARVARAAEVLDPEHIIIENVSAVLHDVGNVVARAAERLSHLGYSLDHEAIEVSSLGVPQRRRRHILIASRAKRCNIKEICARYATPARSVAWAIRDLRDTDDTVFDRPARSSDENKARIEYLFANDEYDLPDEHRPACHRLKDHSYKSVYGRMFWDKPAQTITTGFGSVGQGRYIHPIEQRVITPHEAARLQFIPDFFRFSSETSRTALSEMIGNAVPVRLTYVLALELLR